MSRSARRAITRWAVRLYRQEWRGQLLLLALLALAVAAAIGGGAAAADLAAAEARAQFGSAGHRIEFTDPDPAAIAGDVDAARAAFDEVDVVVHGGIDLPGRFEQLDVRAEEPGGPFTALTHGRWPAGPHEAATTADAADALRLGIGDRVTIDRTERTVVGVVENPRDLDDTFVLVAPGTLRAPTSLVLLVHADETAVDAFRPPSGAAVTRMGRDGAAGATAALAVLAAMTLALTLVALLSTAGFAVAAHRRLRQLGMLAALGATDRQRRRPLVAHGAMTGAAGGLLGAVLGLGGWLVAAPRLETAAAHRIDPWALPWWLVVVAPLLAVAAAVAAAWWPARTVTGVPVVAALAGRPPPPPPPRRAGMAAAPLLLVGVGCLAAAVSRVAVSQIADIAAPALTVIGILAIALGSVALASPALRAAGWVGGRAPVAARIALRDLARFRGRSSAALGAITAMIGVACGVVIVSSAALYTSAAEGNLSDRHMIVRVGAVPGAGDVAGVPARTPAEIELLDAEVAELAAPTGATVTPIDVAVAPDLPGFGGVPAVVVAEDRGGGFHRILSLLYVADAALLRVRGVEPADVPADAEFLTDRPERLWLQPVDTEEIHDPVRVPPTHTSLPGSFVFPTTLADRGWTRARAGWLVESPTAFTEDQLDAAAAAAASSGLTVESRTDQTGLAALRLAATALGALLALGVVTATVGQLRGETALDLRILAAAGATSRVRRRLGATTAGALAALGALLGTGVAYLASSAAHADDLGALWPVPYPHLLTIVAGVPATAAICAWLLAEPLRLRRAGARRTPGRRLT